MLRVWRVFVFVCACLLAWIVIELVFRAAALNPVYSVCSPACCTRCPPTYYPTHETTVDPPARYFELVEGGNPEFVPGYNVRAHYTLPDIETSHAILQMVYCESITSLPGKYEHLTTPYFMPTTCNIYTICILLYQNFF